MRIRDCAARLLMHDGHLLLTHRRPDGDTLGSAAALCHALRRAGKTAYMLPNPETTESYAPFTAPYLAPPDFRPGFVVAVDTADRKMLSGDFAGEVDLVIDHHGSNTLYGKENLVLDRASCGEVVLALIGAALGGADAAEAELLYVAVSTDTGCFRYGNTTAGTLRAAARLIGAGADNGRLNKRLFRTHSPARLRLEGMIYAGLRSERGGQVNIAVVTLDMLEKAGATEDDCEDLAALPGRVAGNRAGVTVRELPGGASKVSLRTDGRIHAADVCKKFGGGGHPMAAGCELDCAPDEAARRICRAICEAWA